MKIERSEMKDLQAVVTMTVEPADYKEQVEKELKDLRHKVQMPGFRPGMVPAGLVKKMYGKGVLADTLNKVIGEELGKYIEAEKLNVLGDPLPNDEKTPDMDLDNQDTFTFAFDIAVAPDFDAKLTGKDKLNYYHITVTDEMVENQVKSYAERFGEYVEADKVEANDMVKGMLKENAEGGIEKADAILTPAYIQDKKIQKLFIGKKVGDAIVFDPMKAYDNEAEVASLLGIKKEELEAHKGEYTFTIASITRHVAAKIDAELFAKIYGDKAPKDEAAFRAQVKAEIESNMAEDSKYKFGLDTKEAIMKKVEKMELPAEFLKRWVKATNKDMKEEELERDFPKMLEELKWHLAKDQLLKHFDIKVEQEDVKAYAREVARMQFIQYGLMHVEDQYLDSFAADMLKKEDQLRGIVERVAENKIYEALKGVAKVTEKEISHEDFGKLFA